ncbi:MAG: type II secretion system protein [Fervidobacterium sp.]
MKKGFTLVELLIVLAVRAALMAVATPMALNAVKQAKASQVAQNLNALKTSVEQYFFSEKQIPKTINDLKNYVSNFDSISGSYRLKYKDGLSTTGNATVVVVYDGVDVSPAAVANQFNLAGTVTIASLNYDGNYSIKSSADSLPGATITVTKWW